eukprot:TRINITY_DN1977_c0_g1_i2.p1 TRINITY_DN1977_c0_g1~~TRINITY_DN1977_c0_g1_i2.p1  ORF type:complete len:369 (-),score=66.99 TRINITY_DN1977_c0_g1_i2:331-1437(-)
MTSVKVIATDKSQSSLHSKDDKDTKQTEKCEGKPFWVCYHWDSKFQSKSFSTIQEASKCLDGLLSGASRLLYTTKVRIAENYDSQKDFDAVNDFATEKRSHTRNGPKAYVIYSISSSGQKTSQRALSLEDALKCYDTTVGSRFLEAPSRLLCLWVFNNEWKGKLLDFFIDVSGETDMPSLAYDETIKSGKTESKEFKENKPFYVCYHYDSNFQDFSFNNFKDALKCYESASSTSTRLLYSAKVRLMEDYMTQKNYNDLNAFAVTIREKLQQPIYMIYYVSGFTLKYVACKTLYKAMNEYKLLEANARFLEAPTRLLRMWACDSTWKSKIVVHFVQTFGEADLPAEAYEQNSNDEQKYFGIQETVRSSS